MPRRPSQNSPPKRSGLHLVAAWLLLTVPKHLLPKGRPNLAAFVPGTVPGRDARRVVLRPPQLCLTVELLGRRLCPRMGQMQVASPASYHVAPAYFVYFCSVQAKAHHATEVTTRPYLSGVARMRYAFRTICNASHDRVSDYCTPSRPYWPPLAITYARNTRTTLRARHRCPSKHRHAFSTRQAFAASAATVVPGQSRRRCSQRQATPDQQWWSNGPIGRSKRGRSMATCCATSRRRATPSVNSRATQ